MIGRTRYQIEVKGTRSLKQPITFFDKCVNRQKPIPSIIDSIADTFASHFKLKKRGFLKILDYFRVIEGRHIGLAGDKGAFKSGKLPSFFSSEDRNILRKMRKVILNKFKQSKDNYFSVIDRTSKRVYIFHTGYGKNFLGAPSFPKFKSFQLKTYGGPSGGSTRIGLSIRLDDV
jgi:hypothetical protein